jgi:hypothetical protein
MTPVIVYDACHDELPLAKKVSLTPNLSLINSPFTTHAKVGE